MSGNGTADEGRDPLSVEKNVDPVTGELLDPKPGSKSRAFSSIPFKYQGITLGARKIMSNYNLFRRALLPLVEVKKLIARAWECSYTGDAQLEKADVLDKAFSYVYLQDPTCGVGILT